jgi:hypothetical protein
MQLVRTGEHSCWPKNQSCCSWRPRNGRIPAPRQQTPSTWSEPKGSDDCVPVSQCGRDGETRSKYQNGATTTTILTTTRSLTIGLRFFDAYLLYLLDGISIRLAVANVPVVLASAIVRSAPATVTEKDPRSFGRPREWPAWRRPMTARVENSFVQETNRGRTKYGIHANHQIESIITLKA